MTTALLTSCVAVLGFVIFFVKMRVISFGNAALAEAGKGVSAMLDPEMDDDQKELAVRKSGLSLIRSTFQVFWRFAISLLAVVATVYAVDLIGLATQKEVYDLMLGWPFLIGTTLIMSVLAWVVVRAQPKDAVRNGTYAASDQLIHKIAFSSTGLQRRLARLEDRLFRHRIESAGPDRPIFIAGLPRAGTTILLNALSTLPDVATHTYRDMPFVTAPLLWSRLSRPFRQRGELTERAHGDGLMIGFDSPEALEEALWRAVDLKKFQGKRLPLWTAGDASAEDVSFLKHQFRKIKIVRRNGRGRYVSKNNGNLARLDLLPAMFPDCRIVTPVRRPADHAASLWRQHRNFSNLHSEDPFAERYMRDIGHLEFGNLHKPIDFDGFDPAGLTPDQPDYWLRYWIAGYSHVLARHENLIVVRHEGICEHPAEKLTALCALLGLEAGNTNFSTLYRKPASQDRSDLFSPKLLVEANAIYEDMAAHSV